MAISENNIKSEAYNLGYEAGENNNSYIKKYNEYRKQFCDPKYGDKNWEDFLKGCNDRKTLIYTQKFEQYNLNQFKTELKELLKKYNVGIEFGCSCGCGGGGFCVGDFEFNINLN